MTIETLSYDRLEQPWRDWARIAWKFALALDNPWDREDLVHDSIGELARVDKKYRQMGKQLTRWGALTVARYRRLRFYHDQARWRKVYSESLDTPARDRDGESRLANVPARMGADRDTWIVVRDHFQGSPEKTKRAVREWLQKEDGHRMCGYEWKLVRQFRTECREIVRPTG